MKFEEFTVAFDYTSGERDPGRIAALVRVDEGLLLEHHWAYESPKTCLTSGESGPNSSRRALPYGRSLESREVIGGWLFGLAPDGTTSVRVHFKSGPMVKNAAPLKLVEIAGGVRMWWAEVPEQIQEHPEGGWNDVDFIEADTPMGTRTIPQSGFIEGNGPQGTSPSCGTL